MKKEGIREDRHAWEGLKRSEGKFFSLLLCFFSLCAIMDLFFLLFLKGVLFFRCLWK